MKHLDFHVAEPQAFAVFGAVHLKARIGVGPKHNRGARLFRQRHMARHKVCMEMRLKNVLDLGPSFVRQIEVRLHFTQRVDNRHLPVAFNVVGPLGQATCVNLLDFHVDLDLVSKSRARISPKRWTCVTQECA